MGQTIRQTMPFNARYAFLQAGKNGRYSQQSRAFPTQVTTYPSTIGVWEDRSGLFLLIGYLGGFVLSGVRSRAPGAGLFRWRQG
jgi:hypothetical protein